MSYPANASPADVLYPDLDDELKTTRAMLACVPDGNNAWQPHTKSYKLGGLASHIAELPDFARRIIETQQYDFATEKWTPAQWETTEERLKAFDEAAGKLREAIRNSTWETLGENWVLRAGDQTYMNDTKAKLVRTMGLSHIAHHRAQLGTYLRQNDVAIPGAYGPSADEMGK